MAPRRAVNWCTCMMIAAWTLAGAGCEKDSPPPPPTGNITPPSAVTPAQGPVSLRLPAPKPLPALLPSAQSSRPPSINPRHTAPLSSEQGVDGRDAANAPSYLPRSNEVAGWFKSESIVVVGPRELPRVMSAEMAMRVGRFGIRSVSTVSYRRTSAGGTQIVHLLAIEANTPDDAYGLTTCASASPVTEGCGGLTRVETAGGTRFFTWQGRIALNVSTDRTAPDDVDAVRHLVLAVVSRIPREERPALLHALPQMGMLPGRHWLVRHLASLEPMALGLNPPIDAEGMSRALGLGPDTLMCIASYEVPRARRADTIWVVQYPSPQAAMQAARRVNRLVASSEARTWQSTNILPARGPYLIGTWTTEEESLQYLLPRVAELLPPP